MFNMDVYHGCISCPCRFYQTLIMYDVLRVIMETFYNDNIEPMLERLPRGVEGALEHGNFHEATVFEVEKDGKGYVYVKSNSM